MPRISNYNMDGVRIPCIVLHESDGILSRNKLMIRSVSRTDNLEEDLEKIVMEYVYFYRPELLLGTSLGWSDKSSVFNNPNRYNSIIIIEDKAYKLTKYHEYVYVYNDSVDKPIITIRLDKLMYEKALDFENLKVTSSSKLFGSLDDTILQSYLKLRYELEEYLGIEGSGLCKEVN